MEQKELNKEDLEEVAGGGIVRSFNCWFSPTGKTKNGGAEAECASICDTFVTCCACYETVFCKDKWHSIYADGYLVSSMSSNHAKKHPPSYND